MRILWWPAKTLSNKIEQKNWQNNNAWMTPYCQFYPDHPVWMSKNKDSLCTICLQIQTISWGENLYYKGWCLSVRQQWNVQMLISPSVLKLFDSQGYLWLSYDLAEVIKLIGETFEPKKLYFFKKILYVIPSASLSFLPYYSHSWAKFKIVLVRKPKGKLYSFHAKNLSKHN